ncbi:MAG: hypothetical protein GVY18_15335, partial [Bacteroidetes bacterium]|nr:hypothetical protein [Bacteroidota bacterium]
MARSASSRSRATAPPEASWWERQSEVVQHGICLVVLLAVIVGFYAPVLFSGKTIVGGDTVNWRAMAEAMIDYREAAGEEPLWNPNAFAGMPGYLISFPKQIPQLDTLVNLLRSAMWPVSHALVLFAGMYVLGVYLTRKKWAAVLAACAYGLTTYIPIILVAGHNTKFVALSYAPWLVLAFAYALRKPRLLSGLLFAVALGLNLRADHVQITYYVSFMLGLWWVVEGVGAVRNDRWKPFLRTTGWLALGSLLALAMVAQ